MKLISILGMWAILGQSSPKSFSHLFSKFGQPQMDKDRREVRCWILSGNEFSSGHPSRCKYSSAVRCLTPFDRDVNLSQLPTTNLRREDKPRSPSIGRQFNLPHLIIAKTSKELRLRRPSSGKLPSSPHNKIDKLLRAERLSNILFDKDSRSRIHQISKLLRRVLFCKNPSGSSLTSQMSF